MARFEPSSQGLWIRERGRGRRVPWAGLVLLPGLTLLVLGFFLCLCLSRDHVWFNGTLWWLAYLREHDSPGGRLAARRLLEVAGASFVRHQRATLDGLLSADPPPGRSALSTLRVYLGEDSLRFLCDQARARDRRLAADRAPAPRARGLLVLESGRTLRVSLRLRGTSYWHHLLEKPSLRLKARGAEGGGLTEVERPEDALAFAAILSESLAGSLGVMSSRSRPVRVLLNGKYRGVYLRVCRPGEELAYRDGRVLPGVFLKGDRFDQQPLWGDPGRWRSYPAGRTPARARLAELCNAVRDWERQPRPEALGRLLDLEACARWSAVLVHSGSTHVDDSHNWLFFCSSASGRLEPVVWDLDGYGIMGPPDLEVNAAPNQLQALLMQDPAWLHRRNQALFELVQGEGSRQAVERRLQRHLQRALPDLRADVARAELVQLYGRPDLGSELPPVLAAGLHLMPVSLPELRAAPDRLLAWVEARDAYILAFLRDCRVSVRAREGGCEVVVHGNVAVLASAPGQPERLLFPGLGPPSWKGRVRVYPAAARTCPLPVDAGRVSFRNAVTGDPVQPDDRPLPPRRSLPEVRFEPPPAPMVRLGPGTVVLSHDLVLEPSRRLRIEPGTRLQMAPGVRILCQGRLEAVGTPARPIVLSSLGPGSWGGLILTGPATGGSRLAHLRLESAVPRGGLGGGLTVSGGLGGGLTVSGCPDLTLEGCRFRSRGHTPATWLADCRVRARDCQWEGAGAAGLELDRCRGSLQGCRWVGGSRGLRLDQATHDLEVEGALFQSCDLGLEALDESRARLRECRWLGCGVAVLAARSRPFLRAGGRLRLEDCRLEGSRRVDLRVERGARVDLLRTRVGRSSGAGLRPSRPGARFTGRGACTLFDPVHGPARGACTLSHSITGHDRGCCRASAGAGGSVLNLPSHG